MATNNQPSNASELQLYRVLQRANLLQYYDTFISQGGDDVQQLCEAGEDEFLEIMALVGMASKPLHVRRLQKALQEWVASPAAFEGNARKSFPTHVMSMTGSGPQTISPSRSVDRASNVQDYKITPPQSSTISTSTPWSSQNANGAGGISPSEGSSRDQPSPADSQGEDYKDVLFQTDGAGGYSSLMGMSQPVLMEHQITAIATAAALLAQELPPFEPKSMPKKQISKEIHTVMTMPQDDPRKMDALRKYAAIYGRFDSKRRNDRPMSLHEISVNEAAAQLCSHFPALLTRREELFPLARQVVRDSGYQYSKGHSRAAEIVVPLKTEPSSDTPTSMASSSPAPQSSEEQYVRAQAELQEVTGTLSELGKEQDRIRSALRVLLEANDHQQMRTLTAEMDDINDQHTALTSRRQDLVGELARLQRNSPRLSLLSGSSTLASSYGLPTMSPKLPSTSDSSGISGALQSSSNPLNTLYMAAMQNSNDSLIEEGLRIATQYGMSDFAQELIGMKNNELDPSSHQESAGPVDIQYDNKDDSDKDSKSAAPATTSSTVGMPISATALLTTASTCSTFMSSPYTSEARSSPSGLATQVSATVNENANLDSSVSPNINDNTTQGTPSAKECSTSNNRETREVANSPTNADAFTPKSNSSTSGNNSRKSSMSPSGAVPISLNENSSTSPSSLAAQIFTSTANSMTPSLSPSEESPTQKPQETETRRSSRRRTADPDYYLINGGEKRFRSSNSRRSSSTSNEHASKMTSPSPSPTYVSSPSGVKVASLSPAPNLGIDVASGGPGLGHGISGDASSGKKGEKKVGSENNLDDSANDHWGDNSADGIAETDDSLDLSADGEKRVGRRKRSHPVMSYAAFK